MSTAIERLKEQRRRCTKRVEILERMVDESKKCVVYENLCIFELDATIAQLEAEQAEVEK